MLTDDVFSLIQMSVTPELAHARQIIENVQRRCVCMCEGVSVCVCVCVCEDVAVCVCVGVTPELAHARQIIENVQRRCVSVSVCLSVDVFVCVGVCVSLLSSHMHARS